MLFKQWLWFAFITMLGFKWVAAESNQDNKSVFSIFEQEGEMIGENKSIWINPDEEDKQNTELIPKKSVNNKDYGVAELKVIDVSFGRSVNIKNIVKEKLDFANLQIVTKCCVVEVAVGLLPQYKAFVEITDKETSSVIFSGWIFSSYRSFAQPVYGNYFFTLSRCLNKE